MCFCKNVISCLCSFGRIWFSYFLFFFNKYDPWFICFREVACEDIPKLGSYFSSFSQTLHLQAMVIGPVSSIVYSLLSPLLIHIQYRYMIVFLPIYNFSIAYMISKGTNSVLRPFLIVFEKLIILNIKSFTPSVAAFQISKFRKKKKQNQNIIGFYIEFCK